jgi:hypothetical protein
MTTKISAAPSEEIFPDHSEVDPQSFLLAEHLSRYRFYLIEVNQCEQFFTSRL